MQINETINRIRLIEAGDVGDVNLDYDDDGNAYFNFKEEVNGEEVRYGVMFNHNPDQQEVDTWVAEFGRNMIDGVSKVEIEQGVAESIVKQSMTAVDQFLSEVEPDELIVTSDGMSKVSDLVMHYLEGNSSHIKGGDYTYRTGGEEIHIVKRNATGTKDDRDDDDFDADDFYDEPNSSFRDR